MRSKSLLLVLSTSLLLSACSDSDSQDETALEQEVVTKELRGEIRLASLSGDPSLNRSVPEASSPLAVLGMQLFYSQALSGDMDTACVSCHHPKLGGGDNLALSIGVEAADPLLLGPGREHSSAGHDYDGGPTVPRNAPTTFNIALWDRAIFHDGRLESIEGTENMNGEGTNMVSPDSPDRATPDESAANLTVMQAMFPVTSSEEMKGHHFQEYDNQEIRQYLVERLRGETGELVTNEWLAAFQLGLQDPDGTAESLITQTNIFTAIGEFERSQVFVNSPWKSFVQGDDDAISLNSKKGALIFFKPQEQGGANCASCHKGDFFTDEEYHNIAMVQVGRGKGDGESGSNDFGRFKVTQLERDKFAFRTPSLLNITQMGPYGHAGSYHSLEAVVRHHLDVNDAINNYDADANIEQQGVQTQNMMSNTLAALNKLNAERNAGTEGVLQDRALSDEEFDQLISFLHTLTDSCIADADNTQCLAPWIPGDDIADPDGLRLEAVIR
ncbi:cytochrome-c peroxidase [Shewanella woodyi]|uniref:Di-haem cytochrome c peroxidase n=1 Tax=Shewanella woodyi (strain ATCC 51908 / MS32) TaxID=392500 RepID=B1KR19_SHEWM|nr:cytochrome c peroxidase [Shewanella woodyi]ACA84836.1 di-haem cytochrome c peroxidase [Shewanella woodyi ATCC 51908]